MRKIVPLFFMFIFLLSQYSLAATIYGNVYDLSIRKVKNAVVEIDSNPNQRIISLDGTYQFEIPKGDYKVTAEYDGINYVLKAEENITIVDEGIYIIDMFLYPEINDESLPDDISFEVNFDKTNIISMNLVIGFLILILVLFLLFKKISSHNINVKETGKNIMNLESDEIKNNAIDETNFINEDNEIKENEDLLDDEIKLRTSIDVNKKLSLKADDDKNLFIKIIKEEGGRISQKDLRKKMPLSEAKVSLIIAELESEGKIKKIKKGRGNILTLI